MKEMQTNERQQEKAAGKKNNNKKSWNFSPSFVIKFSLRNNQRRQQIMQIQRQIFACIDESGIVVYPCENVSLSDN